MNRLLVHLETALVLAHTDGHHFHQPAFHRTFELGVRLDAVDHHDAVGRGGEAIHQDRKPVAREADLLHFHGCADRRPDGRLADPQAFEHLDLPFGTPAAMTAHGREKKGFSAVLAHELHDLPQQGNDVPDSTAPGCDGDPASFPDALGRSHAFQFTVEGCGQVADFGRVEHLPDTVHGRELHSILQINQAQGSRRRARGSGKKSGATFRIPLEPCALSLVPTLRSHVRCLTPDAPISSTPAGRAG